MKQWWRLFLVIAATLPLMNTMGASSSSSLAVAAVEVKDGDSCRVRGQVTGTVKRQFVCVWATTSTKSGLVIGRRLVWELRDSTSSASTTTTYSTVITSTTSTIPLPTPSTTSTIPLPPPCSKGGVCRVGDIGAGGGVVFYVPESPRWWGRYLEAAPYRWNNNWSDSVLNSGCFGLSIPGARNGDIGYGKTSTAEIVSSCPEVKIAARVADDLVINGKSDWFLPSRDELNAMYQQRYVIGGVQVGEDYQWYVSSTFPNDSTHWVQVFTDDSRYGGTKAGKQRSDVFRSDTNRNRVRPIRYGE